MAKRKKNLSPKYQPWVDARKRFHLSDMHIQMARELGMNPKKLGKLEVVETPHPDRQYGSTAGKSIWDLLGKIKGED